MIYYSKHVSGRRAWTRDQVPETDVIVTQEMYITATTNVAFFQTETIDFSEVQFKNQREAKELQTAQAQERIRREAREAESGDDPAARAPRAEPAKPVQFKSADVPKPSILAHDCNWKTWGEENKKLIHYYNQAQKPSPHMGPSNREYFSVSWITL